MQSMLRMLAHGYQFHISGTVKPDRALSMVEKFATKYETESGHDRRARRRKKGFGNATLFVHPSYTEHSLNWWLMLTEGEHPARDEAQKNRQAIRDAHHAKERLTFQDQYQAIKRPGVRSAASDNPASGAPAWTWRMNDSFYDEIAATLRETIRHRNDDRQLKVVIRMIHSLPGFRGVRNQVASLRKVAAAEWRRVKPESESLILPPSVQGYTRFQNFRTVPLELVVERMLAGKPPYRRDWRYPVDSDPGEQTSPASSDAEGEITSEGSSP